MPPVSYDLLFEPALAPREKPAASLSTVPKANSWAIILAGGDGTRLEPYVSDPDGPPTPKQFCRFGRGRSLLALSIDRARSVTDDERIVVVVDERHRRFWEPELRMLPSENVLPQPANRGTAIAILHAVVRIILEDPAAVIAVLPSDHDVDDEPVLADALRDAMSTAAGLHDHLVLLGIPPDGPDPEYGWILPSTASDGVTKRVLTFVENPKPPAAVQLMAWGGLWNTFIFAASGRALFDAIRQTQTGMTNAYLGLAMGGAVPPAALDQLYHDLPVKEFSRDVLQRSIHRLRAVPVPPCGWTDLASPTRLARWLDRRGGAASQPGRRPRGSDSARAASDGDRDSLPRGW